MCEHAGNLAHMQVDWTEQTAGNPRNAHADMRQRGPKECARDMQGADSTGTKPACGHATRNPKGCERLRREHAGNLARMQVDWTEQTAGTYGTRMRTCDSGDQKNALATCRVQAAREPNRHADMRRGTLKDVHADTQT